MAVPVANYSTFPTTIPFFPWPDPVDPMNIFNASTQQKGTGFQTASTATDILETGIKLLPIIFSFLQNNPQLVASPQIMAPQSNTQALAPSVSADQVLDTAMKLLPTILSWFQSTQQLPSMTPQSNTQALAPSVSADQVLGTAMQVLPFLLSFFQSNQLLTAKR